MGLQEIVTVLETYRGREKTLRTVQYGLLLLTPLAKENTRTALQTVSSQFGMARVILRLFDDLPMLQYSWSCIRSTKGKDTFLRCLELTNIAVDQLYFPLEHIAWARDMKVLKGNSASLWHASLLLWGLSLVLTIVRSLRHIYSMKQQTKENTTEERDRVDAMYKAELLTVIMQAANLLNALNWMPRRPWTKPF
ncbi:peroxisomal membrane protein 11C-like [Homarus americanus]|uniref:peroxisomal membrane protein 11C-like n=1 Tax=Homarus americanus TaxID=6706 RepID=UPI001C485CE5|nr:peroxisomal membrane protein 11C-like [Homarus americanus]XP_042228438.1 peroxisomal membrane protein 11C-like [Homarus americanus]XP_042228439.1 peroxisomal membrane protein 11C-like [Homarus americanus]XP_042228440.1 peroxisomal membrane protein 11C-like [Homarus americanus]XP_042228441.1 peroxisomal membrane protein 11C-like [Homarus americanus]XP_042228442.1 peroxisomal membrane protein 11C-like [Homarus americanus]XP_042228443.1 peroxisomal membrane protein 11C-like [Homarus americanu